ncbi:hypothetical protein H634G_06667 [Metarhizium anisopliae BRIP 53293]|uniref:NADP-dependent oxidoreductase domain-containing protein n=1 Tax=Metarhizium anisopliae BRIP 53293 TaxID=1291518 RepID=A0A0D9NVR9_METAN|nr:hypothetical protein H634G_06667 [Metarhizium anisopliae BRIP 53293]KJK85206.1 hypothetical protein H633G_10963 [Metarhizium anisopliae BRIP 53284]
MTDSVPTRQLGRNGPRVTGIGLGLMSFAGWYGQKDTSVESSLALLDRAHEIGERFWDTADIYTGSEQRVGEWFRRSGKRDDIFLATKFAVRAGADGSRTIDNDPAWSILYPSAGHHVRPVCVEIPSPQVFRATM